MVLFIGAVHIVRKYHETVGSVPRGWSKADKTLALVRLESCYTASGATSRAGSFHTYSAVTEECGFSFASSEETATWLASE